MTVAGYTNPSHLVKGLFILITVGELKIMAMNLDNVNVIDINEAEEHTEQPSYYSVIPANVRYDSDLSPYAILLYGEITALTHKNGYCYASNTYFAKRYERTPQAVSKWINQLAEKGYINIVYCRCKNIIVERRIYITSEVSTTVDRVSTPVDEGINQELIGYQQRIKENNKYNNKTNNKISEVDTSDFPEDPNETKTKKTNKPHKPTKTELTKQYLSSLPLETYNASRRCAYNLIQYLVKLQNSSTAATNLDSWQRDFAQFATTEKKDFNEIAKVIDHVFHDNYWMSRISSAPAIIKNYGMFYQRMNGTSTKSNYQQKQEEAIGRVAMNTDKDYSL